MISNKERKRKMQQRQDIVAMSARMMDEPSKQDLREQLRQAFENTARLGLGLPPIRRIPAKGAP